MTDYEFKDLQNAIDKDEIVLLLSNSESIEEVKMDMLEDFTEKKKMSVIYVSITKPYDAITDILEQKGIETDEIFFIDCMSKAQEEDVAERAKNCVFIDPRNLTNISIAISEAVESLPEEEKKLVVFDTLSALRVYNEDEPLQQFSQFLTSKMRNWQVKSVILTLEEEMDDEVVARVSQFCDRQIHTG